MTDRETFRAMLTRAGVVFTEDASEIKIEAEDGFDDKDAKNQGYFDFYAVFEFNEDESLKAVGIWE